VLHPTLGLRVIQKKKTPPQSANSRSETLTKSLKVPEQVLANSRGKADSGAGALGRGHLGATPPEEGLDKPLRDCARLDGGDSSSSTMASGSGSARRQRKLKRQEQVMVLNVLLFSR